MIGEEAGMSYIINRAWAEVNLDHIAHNVKEIRRIVNKNAEIMAVVKADAYGHGVTGVVDTLLESGAAWLAVSMLDEAIQLRRLGIGSRILVLGYTSPERADEIIDYNVTQTVFSHDLVNALSEAAVRKNKKVKIHIKIDTGMTRVGFMPGYSAVKNVMEIGKLPGIIIEGLFTHFASADETDKSYTCMQFERFMSICSELNRVGLYIPVKHCCNSAGVMEYPEMHLNLVRPGIILYGMYPSTEVDKSKLYLKPAMTLKANVVLVKDVEKGACISYGRIFTTSRDSRIATVSIGYADGYTRLLNCKGRVLVRGWYAPVVGKICMDQCMIDVTDIDDVSLGDDVVLFGEQGGNSIPVEEVAGHMGTINYEVVCIIGKRIPRVYIREGQVLKIHNYLVE